MILAPKTVMNLIVFSYLPYSVHCVKVCSTNTFVYRYVQQRFFSPRASWSSSLKVVAVVVVVVVVVLVLVVLVLVVTFCKSS